MDEQTRQRRRRDRGRSRGSVAPATRTVDYRHLVSPLPLARGYSDDRIADITAYYTPWVSDWSNFGQWEEAGGRTATERAHDLWRRVLAQFRPPAVDPGTVEAIDAFIARRVEAGGAAPVS